MTYIMSWTLANGEHITDQRYTADAISKVLNDLESWNAKNIKIESEDLKDYTEE